MTLIVDTGPILARLNPASALAQAVTDVLSKERSKPVMPQTVAAELDYMLGSRGGPEASRELLRDVAAGRFDLSCLEPGDLAAVLALDQKYRDLKVGLVDLSVVVLAARYRTTRLLTLDQRHFRLIRPLQGGVFTLLPFDEDIV